MSKKLVAYFSATGTTRAAAEKLAKAANADVYEIKAAPPYTATDLVWTDEKSRSTIEMHDKSFRPAIADKNANIAEYETILLCFPIWWFVAPTIINTFLESYDFSGKTIIVFATSLGSNFEKTVEELSGSVDSSAKILEGKILGTHETIASLSAWLDYYRV